MRKRLLDGTGIKAQFGLAPATPSFGGVPVGGRCPESLVTLSNTSAGSLPIRGIASVPKNLLRPRCLIFASWGWSRADDVNELSVRWSQAKNPATRLVFSCTVRS